MRISDISESECDHEPEGVRRKNKNENTETEWHKKRRAAVANELAKSEVPQTGSAKHGTLSRAHKKELAFQKAKRTKRKVECMR